MYKLQVVKAERPEKPPKEPKEPKLRKPRKKWSRRRKALVALAVLVLGVVGTYYYVHKTLTGPAIGTVITTIPANERKEEVELEQFDGKLFSFVHPIQFVEQATKPGQVPNALEVRRFLSSQMTSQFISITIAPLPSKNLDDDASYKMRAMTKDKYKARNTVIKNEKVYIFTSEDGGLEQSAFWLHGDKLLTFVLTSRIADPQETKKQYNDMLASISWR